MLRDRLLPILLTALTSLLFAGSFIAGKFTTVELSPILTTLLRYLIALVFLSSLLIHYKKSSLLVQKKDVFLLALLGLFGVVGYHFFFFLSLRYTAIANTAIINAFNPVITGIAAALFIRERLTLQNYFGGAIALVGVLALLSKGDIGNLIGLQINRGDGLMLCAVLSWVVYSLLIKVLSQRYSGFTVSFYAAGFGLIWLLLLSLREDWATVARLSPAAIASLGYMGVGASGLGYFLYNLSVKAIGPTRASSSVYSLVPIFVTLLAFAFFRQPMTVLMLFSMSLIILGLHFTLKSRSRG
ncbi:DMT family transporter [Thermoleptolyngbya oregonensis NK1-22]|uniref:DMT family transporter n=2 Tax=Thermoleptolyngbya TaxID=2303528 RepID=A0AA96Y7W9_9CYAN|nr:DMT family transporter [Thermoleptolyngbya oregonensis NK1-22]